MAPPVAVAAAAPMAEAAVAQEPSIERSGDPGSRLATGAIQGRAGPPVTGEAGPDPARAGEGAGQAATGSGAGTVNVSAGGAGGAPADYLGQLRAWLERHKDYPRMAQRRRIEGRVMLGFVIDRQGAVLSWRIERSSGHDILDAAVVDLIVRAAPLPAIPAGLALAQLDVVVPIDFGLR